MPTKYLLRETSPCQNRQVTMSTVYADDFTDQGRRIFQRGGEGFTTTKKRPPGVGDEEARGRDGGWGKRQNQR